MEKSYMKQFSFLIKVINHDFIVKEVITIITVINNQ